MRALDDGGPVGSPGAKKATTLRLPEGSKIVNTMDPGVTSGGSGLEQIQNMFEGLVYVDQISGEIKAGQAEKWTVSADPHGEPLTEDGFSKLFQRLRRRAGLKAFSAHLMRHTWATNFMRQPGASLLELKRQGGWQRCEQVERYSHAVPTQDRRTLPNPFDPQKSAPGQLPSARVLAAAPRS